MNSYYIFINLLLVLYIFNEPLFFFYLYKTCTGVDYMHPDLKYNYVSTQYEYEKKTFTFFAVFFALFFILYFYLHKHSV